MSGARFGRAGRSARRLAACTTLAGLIFSGGAPELSAQPPAQVSSVGTVEKVTDLVDEVLSSEVELKVMKRRSKILRLKQEVYRAAVADPSLVEFVAYGAKEVEIIGKEVGSTTVTLWIGDENQPRLLSVLVNVVKDEGVDDTRRLEYGELQEMINELFPNSKVQLFPVADKVIVRGQARDEQEAVQIMSIIRRNAMQQQGNGINGGGQGAWTAQGDAAQPFPDASKLPDATVVNMLKIPGEKQVLLKVRIAELKRSAIRKLGSNFAFNIDDIALASTLTTGGNILASGVFDNSSFNLVLSALSSNGTAKILAEPNLVTLSGQPANFIAGGEFAVPTVVGVGGAQAATTTFKGYGTQLAFTPTVLDRDRIRIHVAPTFSTLNKENTVGGVFGLDTRSVSTTVDLREGQVLAIAGLLQEQQRGSVERIPLFGSIPILNAITANRSTTKDETELIVLVSPELVHAMEPEDAPSILPGMEVTDPDDLEFFIFGHIEGRQEVHHRSTVWAQYRDNLKHCRKASKSSDCYYINGPHGFSE